MSSQLQNPSAQTAPLIRMENISKSFPGVRALHEVQLELHSGEVLALLGENGAGKSTLIKVLGGIYQPDQGAIAIDGKEARFHDPAAAHEAGIGVIHQELNLIPELTAWENIGLGRERNSWWVSRSSERELAADLFRRLGVSIPLDLPCRMLSIAQQQIVEIAKALAYELRILVMDEPTAALTPREVSHLFALLKALTQQGLGVIYISHRLDEIQEIADRIMILRDGEKVSEFTSASADRQQLIEAMVGRPLNDEFPARQHSVGERRLVVRGLRGKAATHEANLEVHSGEIVALTGLIGAGRTELARLIFGADRIASGTIELDGIELKLRSPRDAIRNGICLLTEDRKHQGLILDHTLRHNFALPNFDSLSSWGWLTPSLERGCFSDYVEKLSIKTPSHHQPAGALSGGNQQKVVLAKWLQRDAKVIIFDEPTRGIDVGAKYEIYQLMNELARQGKAILMISSELPEVLGMSDRVLVMHEGRITGSLGRHDKRFSQAGLMDLAVR